jgi:translation initiation factor 4E
MLTRIPADSVDVGRSSKCQCMSPGIASTTTLADGQGGKWVVLIRSAPHLMDFAWANLVMGLVGNVLDPDDEVCGIVASSRPKVDRVQLWTRTRSEENVESLNALGKRIVACMGLDANEQGCMSIEFQVSYWDLCRQS